MVYPIETGEGIVELGSVSGATESASLLLHEE
jgi:hypothetical protein